MKGFDEHLDNYGDPGAGTPEPKIKSTRNLRAKLARDGYPYWAGHFHPKASITHKGEMIYEMIRAGTRLRDRITMPKIQVTNGICGAGKGWDVLFFGTIIDHHNLKTDAQRAAERCLDRD